MEINHKAVLLTFEITRRCMCDSPSKALALSGELEFIRAPRITSEIAYAVAVTNPPIRSSVNARHGTGHSGRIDVDATHGGLCGRLIVVVRSAAPPSARYSRCMFGLISAMEAS